MGLWPNQTSQLFKAERQVKLSFHSQDKKWELTNGLRGKWQGGKGYFLNAIHLEEFPFSTFLWPQYTRSKSASLRVILSALVHPDVMNLLIKQHEEEAVGKTLPVFIVCSWREFCIGNNSSWIRKHKSLTPTACVNEHSWAVTFFLNEWAMETLFMYCLKNGKLQTKVFYLLVPWLDLFQV